MKNINKVYAGVLIVVFAFGLTGLIFAVGTAVNLGTAEDFAILAGSAITDSNPTGAIIGDVGLSPTTGAAITGLTCAQVTGTIYDVDNTYAGLCEVTNPGLLTTAKSDLVAAYTDANGQVPDTFVDDGDLGGGETLTPGVYSEDNTPNSLSITGELTLDGGGNPNAVFIFQSDSTLITAAGSIITLTNGTQACNVFWQVGSSVTFGTGSDFAGTVMAITSIIDNGDSTILGRLLADADGDGAGAVTLNNTDVTVPTCLVPGGGSSSSAPRNFTVVKQVINDSGGTAVVSDFPLFVNGSPVTSGVSVEMVPGAYVVTETTQSNYTATYGGDCNTEGEVTHGSGNSTLCTVVNDDIGPAAAIVPPLIDVVKVPNPLALPNGPGPVTYTYTLRNIGTVPVTDVTMIGDTCSPIVLISGDTDDDNQLDVNEVWVHRCSTTLSATHTNTVVASGWANGLNAIDVASATVVVGAPVVPPLIHVTKVPNILTMFGAGPVTYNYAITNPGTVAMSNVAVSDDKCSQISITSAGNNNGLLEPGEVWNFTCQMNLTATTTNTVSVSGQANGFIVRDFALATVAVSNPTFPGAGFPPSKVNLWVIIMTAGLLISVPVSFVLAKRYIKI